MIILIYLNDNIYFGSAAVVNDNLIVEFNDIMTELNKILQEFFGHIQSMEINKGIGALDEEGYIKVVKETAIENYRIINWNYTYTLIPAINA